MIPLLPFESKKKWFLSQIFYQMFMNSKQDIVSKIKDDIPNGIRHNIMRYVRSHSDAVH